ncbi:MAG: Uma2 family endonuclease [Bryobacterales bacterium]
MLTADHLRRAAGRLFQYELDGGELICMAPAGEGHGRVEGDLYGLLFVEIRRLGLGRLYPSDTGFVLSEEPATVRSPDIAFVANHRLPLETRKDSGFIVGAPDLAIEIQSSSQSPADLARKVEQYLAAGAQAVWVLRPARKIAEIHEKGKPTRRIDKEGFLEADVVPGVRIRLSNVLDSPEG